ncbi:MAG: ATP-binding protein [Bacteroidales bacterium]|nr:ATP-binding protein [Bacteroidales bacterium]
MNKADITDFIVNVAILLIFEVIYDFYWIKYRETKKTLMQYASGIVFGTIGIFLCIENIGWYSDLYIDAKTVLLCLIGLFFGFKPTLTAIIMIITYIIFADTPQPFYNIIATLISATTGLFFYKFDEKWIHKHYLKTLTLVAFISHILIFALLPTILDDNIIETMIYASFTILGIFPLATILLGRLMVTNSSQWNTKDKLIQLEEKFNSVALCSDDCFWEMDEFGKVIYVSDNVTKILGYQKNELLGQRPYILIDNIETKNLLLSFALNQNIDKNTIFDNNVVLKHKDNIPVHCNARGLKRFDRLGKLIGYTGIIHNASEQYYQHELLRRNQMQLREQLKKYEDNNKQLQENLNTISSEKQQLIKDKEKAQNSDNIKRVYLANISHEIRTPVNAIAGFLDLILDSSTAESEKNKFGAIIKNRCEELTALLDDILDMEKLEEGLLTINNEIGNIKDMFNELYDFYKSRNLYVDKKNIILSQNVNIDQYIIKTDFGRLKQVLSNLIDNAFNYTINGKINFSCNLYNEGKQLIFAISDTGIGIPKDSIDTLFNRYQINENPISKSDGSGLGLAISKGIVELMGGKIWVESQVNVGSTFFFTIPYNIAQQSSLVDQNYDWKNKNLLIISKDRFSAIYLSEKLIKTNIKYKVISLERSSNITILENYNENIDIIVVDSKLSKSDYSSKISDFINKHNQVPIIALCENEKFKSYNFDNVSYFGYILKPFDGSQINNTISLAFNNQ